MNKDSNESKSEHLSRSSELALTVFPKSAEFVEPAEKALCHPNLCAANILDLIGELLAGIASVHQKLLHMRKIVQVEKNHLNRPIPICNISRCYSYGVRQSHRINYDVAFDS